MTTRATLTDAGHVLHADSSFQRATMTSGGRIAPPGRVFHALRVVSITGGTSPSVVLRNGFGDDTPALHRLDAVAGAEVDRRMRPQLFNLGMWLSVLGEPSSIEVEVLFS